MKISKVKLKPVYLISIVLISILSIFFYSYVSNYKVNKFINNSLDELLPWIGGIFLETSAMNIFNNIDVRKLFINKNKEDIIDLKLSIDDIKELDNAYKCSHQDFLHDECKLWRKAKFKYGEFQTKIKLKVSGTSTTPYRRSHDFFDRVYKKFFDSETIHDITHGGVSFVVKFQKENFFQNHRRVTLLSPFDEWSYFQSVFNEYASEKGLITTFGRPYLLHINGIDSGVYLLQETIGKELLERNYGITDYAILKPNDDWDSIPFGHQSNTDYISEDKEQSGTSMKTIGMAQNQLKKMLNTLDSQDFKSLSKFFDIDYMAKVSAMQLIYGSSHASIGDNRRYIYNISNGLFYPSFRMESGPRKLSIKDGILPEFPGYYQEDKVLQILEANEGFLIDRNRYLAEFINDSKIIERKYNDFKRQFGHLITSTNQPNYILALRNTEGAENFLHNIDVLKKYLTYGKVYITKIQNNLNECKFSIFVDSYSEILLSKALLDSKTKNLDLYLTKGRNEIKFDENWCPNKFEFKNSLIGNMIEKNKVYYNFEIDTPTFSSFKNTFKYSENGKDIRIFKGVYRVSENIKFPDDRGVIIEPGVTITIDDNKSILFHNEFTAVGNDKEKIIFMSNDNAFGSILIKANGNKVTLDKVQVSGGNEAYVENIYASGQIVIVDADVEIKNSKFSSSISDDGINIKYSKVNIESNIFTNNYGDQIDLDYSSGRILNNSFVVSKQLRGLSETDGLDVSGSDLHIENNYFSGFSDKAISIGEKSNIIVENNKINESNIGVAVKDGSVACFSKNNFHSNSRDISSYIKKSMYKNPKVILSRDQKKIKNDPEHDIRDSCNGIK